MLKPIRDNALQHPLAHQVLAVPTDQRTQLMFACHKSITPAVSLTLDPLLEGYKFQAVNRVYLCLAASVDITDMRGWAWITFAFEL